MKQMRLPSQEVSVDVALLNDAYVGSTTKRVREQALHGM